VASDQSNLLQLNAERCRLAVSQDAQRTRELLETRLFAAWGDRHLQGNPLADNDLAAVECIAASRRALFGDLLYSESTRVIREASASALHAIADAHLSYTRGRTLYDAGEREAARLEFSKAARALKQAGSPFHYEASLQYAIATYQVRDVDAAFAEAQRVLQHARDRSYPTLAARANWLIGLTQSQNGRMEEAVDSYDDARKAYEVLLEPENAASVANSAADTLRLSGDVARGWAVLGEAVRSLPFIRSPQRRYLILYNLSLYAQTEEAWDAAREFQNAAVAAADQRGQVLTMIESRLQRAQLNLRTGDVSAAVRDLTRAEALLESVPSPTSAAYLRAWIDRLGAAAGGATNDAAASQDIEELVPRFQQIEPAEVPSLYLQAGQFARSEQNVDRASELLRQGVAAAAERRRSLATDEFRIAHFGTTWDLYHELIDLEFNRRPLEALAVADEGRTVLASRQTLSDSPSPLELPLSPDQAILYYAALRNRLLIWVIAEGRVETHETPYSSQLLTADVAALRAAIHFDAADEVAQLGSELFSRIVAPALLKAPRARRLLIAADGPLTDLPFAALRERNSGRFLADDYELQYIAALSLLRENTPNTVERALSIGYNGAPGSRVRLASAEDEARAVSRIYPRGRAITGPDASPAGIQTFVPGQHVIHIAAHAEANRTAPWLSFLQLAPHGSRVSSGVLRFGQTESWDLRLCRVVVLSACDTAAGARLRAFGAINLAMPFLVGGAGSVIGTQWPIDDRASALFTPILHGYMASGSQPAAALRQAQSDARRSPIPELRRMRTWAAWTAHTRDITTR
jgi:CHAT domain-containing protein